ncbi:MAG: type II toxin-antitoxin system VapB family antitoxin [Terracidiphilus sp.]|jgi:Arc/MetJ family transcription regulator
MRTNIEIDDKLMKQAMKATGATTKKATVEAAMREVVQLRRQGRIRKLFAIGGWEGSLAAMREGHLPEWEAEQAMSRSNSNPKGNEASAF